MSISGVTAAAPYTVAAQSSVKPQQPAGATAAQAASAPAAAPAPAQDTDGDRDGSGGINVKA